MVVYTSCGLFGLYAREATSQELMKSNFSLENMYSECLIPKGAQFSDLSEEQRNCSPNPEEDSINNISFRLDDSGSCVATCSSGFVQKNESNDQCVSLGGSCSDSKSASGSYEWSSEGKCSLKCDPGSVHLSEFSVGLLDSLTCPPGYSPIKSKEECQTFSELSEFSQFQKNMEESSKDSPPGCYIGNASSVNGKSVLFNSNSQGSSSKDAFVACKRTSSEPCSATAGSECIGKAYPNYVWSSEGKCKGTCGLHQCLPGQSCCNKMCVNDASLANGRCPTQQETTRLLADAANVASSAITSAIAK